MSKQNKTSTKSHQQPIDALELLKALNTLKHSSQHYEEEMSFGQHHQRTDASHMNFEIYMEKKTVEQPKTSRNELSSVKTHRRTNRKSVTPLKDMTRYTQGPIERKSLSPFSQTKMTQRPINKQLL